jgi:hypothetical protein
MFANGACVVLLRDYVEPSALYNTTFHTVLPEMLRPLLLTTLLIGVLGLGVSSNDEVIVQDGKVPKFPCSSGEPACSRQVMCAGS